MGVQRSEWPDRQEIHDVVLRYCRGVDRLDFDFTTGVRFVDHMARLQRKLRGTEAGA